METKYQTLECELFTVTIQEAEIFHIEIKPLGDQCDLLSFLKRTSDENDKEFLSKLCAIGYLNSYPKTRDKAWAVICQNKSPEDYRNGKTFFTKTFIPADKSAVVYSINCHPINPFMFQVPDGCRYYIVDDVYPGQNFWESMFNYITGDWHYQAKGKRPASIPFDKSPRIIITTAYPETYSKGTSFDERYWFLSFGNYYSQRKFQGSDYSFYSTLIKDCMKCFETFGKIQAHILRKHEGS